MLIILLNSSIVSIPNLFFGLGSYCSSESAKFEKNLQKVFALFFELKETTPCSFNHILDCIPPLEGIPRNSKVHQSSLGLFLFSAIFSSK